MNAYQSRRFSGNIGAPIRQAPAPAKRLFNSDLIEEVFIAQESFFNSTVLRELTRDKLAKLDVPVLLNTSMQRVTQFGESRLDVALSSTKVMGASAVFLCADSQITPL